MTDTARLEVGDKAPAFSLPDADGKTVKLSDFKGRKVIVYFYPAASTPGCTKQACDFRDSLAGLNDAGIDVVGISPDKPEKLAKFRDAESLTFPLLSDPDKKVLSAWGTFGEKKLYGKTVQGVIRSTRGRRRSLWAPRGWPPHAGPAKWQSHICLRDTPGHGCPNC